LKEKNVNAKPFGYPDEEHYKLLDLNSKQYATGKIDLLRHTNPINPEYQYIGRNNDYSDEP
jgi:hypothetical protein